MRVIEEIASLMAGRGQQNYGENVTIAEHVLLTAAAAEMIGCSESASATAVRPIYRLRTYWEVRHPSDADLTPI